MLNVLSVDVEEYFHPAEVAPYAPEAAWLSLPSRVDGQVRRVLELLDQRSVKATFFVLGWVAEHHPRTIQAIVAAGHEIGCHSYSHRLVYRLDPAEFRRDTVRAIRAIEDSCGITPRAYRAPSYSITRESLWALEILVDLGFTRDSSIYPIAHDRYGIPGSSRHLHMVETPAGPICELPIATVQLSATQVVPIGGGGYLRLLPYRYTAAGIRRVNQDEKQPACIYFHPWEIDPEQPRLAQGLVSQLRTYSGIGGMQRKLTRLLEDFEFSTVSKALSDFSGSSPLVQAANGVGLGTRQVLKAAN